MTQRTYCNKWIYTRSTRFNYRESCKKSQQQIISFFCLPISKSLSSKLHRKKLTCSSGSTLVTAINSELSEPSSLNSLAVLHDHIHTPPEVSPVAR